MNERRLIKKYANRRLYDTVESRHVTLADLRRMIVAGNDVKVVDDTSGEDITRPLLLQIIVDREQAGQPILTELLLAQLIRFYGNPMQGMMADYLQRSVDTFVDQQQSVQRHMQSALSTKPIDTMRDLMKHNVSAWEALMGLPVEGVRSEADGPADGAEGVRADGEAARDEDGDGAPAVGGKKPTRRKPPQDD